jgi:hypothetical protein
MSSGTNIPAKANANRVNGVPFAACGDVVALDVVIAGDEPLTGSVVDACKSPTDVDTATRMFAVRAWSVAGSEMFKTTCDAMVRAAAEKADASSAALAVAVTLPPVARVMLSRDAVTASAVCNATASMRTPARCS